MQFIQCDDTPETLNSTISYDMKFYVTQWTCGPQN